LYSRALACTCVSVRYIVYAHFSTKCTLIFPKDTPMHRMILPGLRPHAIFLPLSRSFSDCLPSVDRAHLKLVGEDYVALPLDVSYIPPLLLLPPSRRICMAAAIPSRIAATTWFAPSWPRDCHPLLGTTSIHPLSNSVHCCTTRRFIPSPLARWSVGRPSPLVVLRLTLCTCCTERTIDL